MNPACFLRRGFGIGLAAAAFAVSAAPALAVTASAPAPVDPLSSCGSPTLTQPFAALKDQRYYTLAPGGRFAGEDGWDLTGGAQITDTTQADGSTGGVLDLPSGSQAVSPVMCVSVDYPIARLAVRNVVGGEGVFFYVSYLKGGVWSSPHNTGQFHGEHSDWTVSKPVNLQPTKTSGWQQVRYILVPGGRTSRFQVDDFWVDPRIRF
jgi:hypothetical protein